MILKEISWMERLKKFISDNTLLNQPYIKDGSLSLKKIIKDNKIISLFPLSAW